jgi:polysaccharide deacetylase family protein (PEP-CTERM system associated)
MGCTVARVFATQGAEAAGPRFLATFDIEDWFHAENVRAVLPTDDWTQLESRVEPNAHELLDILAELGLTSTFFVLGWIARRYPSLVRRIAAEGHEVASHTDLHRRLYELSREELLDDLARAKATIEDLTGAPVRGIRAPTFSISDAVLDGLAEAGYWYDSSYYALGVHDRYGRLDTPIDPESAAVEVRPGLLELPMSRLSVARSALPWSGGGYFRLIPYAVYRRGVARRLRTRSWFMFYLHPWELDTGEVPPPGMARSLRFRAYVGRRRVRRDLRRLLAEFGSQRIDHALLAMGHTPPPSA